MATHSSILAWRIPWTEEPGGYGLQGHTEYNMTEHTRTQQPFIEDLLLPGIALCDFDLLSTHTHKVLSISQMKLSHFPKVT